MACLSNAAQMGVSPAEATAPNAISPFPTRTWHLSALFDLSADLRPCALQVRVPHPIWIDTIPLPKFRSALLWLMWSLSLADIVPPVGEEGMGRPRTERLLRDLGRDINNGGIRYAGQGSGLMDAGKHADGRFWVVEGWFAAKWAWLLGG